MQSFGGRAKTNAMITRRRLFSALSGTFPPGASNAPLPNRRVVVTGLGTVNPLGLSVNTSWKRLLEGTIGIDHIPMFEEAGLPVHIGAKVKVGSEDHDEEYLNKEYDRIKKSSYNFNKLYTDYWDKEFDKYNLSL